MPKRAAPTANHKSFPTPPGGGDRKIGDYRMVFKNSKQAKLIAKHPELFKRHLKAAKEAKKIKDEKSNKFTEALA